MPRWIHSKQFGPHSLGAAKLAEEQLSEGAPDRSHLPPSVWLRKKAATIGRDKKRYFVLEGKEFQYFQDSYNGVGVNKKGVIDLKEMTEVTSDGKMIMLVTGEDEIVGGNRQFRSGGAQGAICGVSQQKSRGRISARCARARMVLRVEDNHFTAGPGECTRDGQSHRTSTTDGRLAA